MAVRGQCREMVKDRNSKQSNKRQQNDLPDEIALRDEIFQLKRQIMLLKKANERNVIKVRKYEDEARKKDRQIEELMDPVKNGDVRKLLSTKGAAILLNLKEQNNTLIQMILDKDAQIRKLLSEIKTSKLYANTRRFESYRNEIERLRNLLIKSQSVMKEAQEVPQRRSICVGGSPPIEVALSSDQSSPRGLEELQFAIQSLEMHMKYSNELLMKKNEQINRLTDQLNAQRCSNCRNIIQPMNSIINDGNSIERDASVLSEATDGNTYEIISPKSTLLFDKNVSSQQKLQQETRRLSNSAPAAPARSTIDDQPRECFRLTGANDHQSGEDGKIRFSIAKPGNRLDRFFTNDPDADDSRSLFTESDNSDMETAEFELMEKKIENDQIEVESPVRLKRQSVSDGDVGSPVTSREKIDESEDAKCARSGNDESPTGSVRTVFESDLKEESREKTFIIGDENNRDFARESPNLSYDSESSGNGIVEVEVEAEINHNGTADDDNSDSDLINTTEIDEDDDDDDVVIH